MILLKLSTAKFQTLRRSIPSSKESDFLCECRKLKQTEPKITIKRCIKCSRDNWVSIKRDFKKTMLVKKKKNLGTRRNINVQSQKKALRYRKELNMWQKITKY